MRTTRSNRRKNKSLRFGGHTCIRPVTIEGMIKTKDFNEFMVYMDEKKKFCDNFNRSFDGDRDHGVEGVKNTIKRLYNYILLYGYLSTTPANGKHTNRTKLEELSTNLTHFEVRVKNLIASKQQPNDEKFKDLKQIFQQVRKTVEDANNLLAKFSDLKEQQFYMKINFYDKFNNIVDLSKPLVSTSQEYINQLFDIIRASDKVINEQNRREKNDGTSGATPATPRAENGGSD